MSLLSLLLALLFGAADDATASVQVRPLPEDGRVEVVATLPEAAAARLPEGALDREQGQRWLTLALVHEGKDGPAMFGMYERTGRQLAFRPRFALEPGQTYRARFSAPDGASEVVTFVAPQTAPEGDPAAVVKVYPSGDVLPANQLRFYIKFSRPMRGGDEIFDHMEILDEQGKAVYEPWLRDEFWADRDRTLLLYIQPGRIKWGLLLRELFGPVLVPGRQYTLVIHTNMLDADGRKLAKEYRKTFRTAEEHRRRVELSEWKVQAPAAGTSAPLTLEFPQPLDLGSLQRFLGVIDARGETVAGKITVGKDERSWQFRPARNWRPESYRVVVDSRLEDTAGNTPLRPFDRDLQAEVPPPQLLELAFRPRAGQQK